jgi:hypothetical protein
MVRTSSPVASIPVKPPAFGGVFAGLAPHMAALDRFLQGQLSSFEPEIRDMVN